MPIGERSAAQHPLHIIVGPSSEACFLVRRQIPADVSAVRGLNFQRAAREIFGQVGPPRSVRCVAAYASVRDDDVASALGDRALGRGRRCRSPRAPHRPLPAEFLGRRDEKRRNDIQERAESRKRRVHEHDRGASIEEAPSSLASLRAVVTGEKHHRRIVAENQHLELPHR